MRRSSRLTPSLLTATALLVSVASPTAAGGYLWLGSEFQGEGNIYRFNLATGQIDMVQAHSGASHWNNVATDGTSLWLGHPTTQTLNRHDAYSGALIALGTYAPALAGHKEDGAFHDGSLWRISHSGTGALHRTTTAGVAETTFTIAANPGFVGLEWVRDTAFVTVYAGRDIGTLRRTGPTTVAFTARPWAAGEEPPHNHAALAHDAEDDVLYMATNSHRLYRVTFAGGLAFSDLVADLSTVGYPAGGLVDGMGWLPLETVDVPPSGGPAPAQVELSAPWPNPAREAVWFDLRLPRPMATRVGIYDAAGRAHRVWDLPGLGAGASRFMWDFRGADGRRVPAGVYFVRATTAAGEVAGRVVRIE